MATPVGDKIVEQVSANNSTFSWLCEQTVSFAGHIIKHPRETFSGCVNAGLLVATNVIKASPGSVVGLGAAGALTGAAITYKSARLTSYCAQKFTKEWREIRYNIDPSWKKTLGWGCATAGSALMTFGGAALTAGSLFVVFRAGYDVAKGYFGAPSGAGANETSANHTLAANNTKENNATAIDENVLTDEFKRMNKDFLQLNMSEFTANSAPPNQEPATSPQPVWFIAPPPSETTPILTADNHTFVNETDEGFCAPDQVQVEG